MKIITTFFNQLLLIARASIFATGTVLQRGCTVKYTIFLVVSFDETAIKIGSVTREI